MIYNQDDEENFLSDRRVGESNNIPSEQRRRGGAYQEVKSEKRIVKLKENEDNQNSVFSTIILVIALIVATIAVFVLFKVFTREKPENNANEENKNSNTSVSVENNTNNNNKSNNSNSSTLWISNVNDMYNAYSIEIESVVYKKGGNFFNKNEKIEGDKAYIEYKQISGLKDSTKEEKINEKLKEKMFESTLNISYKLTLLEKELEELEKIEEEKINASSDFSYASENMNVFEEKEEEYPEISYKFLGIAFNTYIIIEIKNEMYVIDQHAAHERIMYEKVKANYYSEDQKDEQFLLLPDVITLTHKDMIIAKENREMFEKAGFSFEEFGENTIKLISVPSMCENLNTKQLFLDILDEIDTVAVTARQEKEDKFIATVACKAAVKAKMKLDEEEVKSLMEKLLELPNPFTCPHGRPTAIKMTKYDLEKKFSRR